MNLIQNFKQNKIWYLLGAGLLLAIIGYFLFRKSNKKITSQDAATPLLPDRNDSGINWEANNDNFPLKFGSYGPRVKAIQYWLMNSGQILPSGTDGKFGKETETALKKLKNRDNISEAYWNTNKETFENALSEATSN